MAKPIDQHRRRFLRGLALAAAGSSFLGYQGRFELVRSALAAAPPTDYKSLVCVFLFGGNDSFNMFVPFDDGGYAEYAGTRQNLAIPKENLLPVADGLHAFHPSLGQVRGLYDQGKVAVIANVGNLLEPTTKDDYRNGTAALPPDLYSHSHQQEIWQTNLPPEPTVKHPGWGGLLGDRFAPDNGNPLVPPGFSTFGTNLWQAGVQTQPFSLDPENGAETFEFLDGGDDPPWQEGRTAAWHAILGLSRSHLFEQQVAGSHLGAIERVRLIKDAVALSLDPDSGEDLFQTPYDGGNPLAVQLRMAARLIYARESLGMKRQIIFVGAGGFDTHSDQMDTHNRLLAMVDGALSSFQATLDDDIGAADSVVTFTASEFSRTLTSNGDGSDHAWGGHHLVMGGAVQGGAIYGQMPSLALDSADDAEGDGRLIPTLSVDQYGATLAAWMGLTETELLATFPNLGNFPVRDLGFLG